MISEKLREDALRSLDTMEVMLRSARAMIRNEAGETPPPAPDPMPEAMRKLQAYLLGQGFDAGPPDGVYGPRTAAALLEFEQRGCLDPRRR